MKNIGQYSKFIVSILGTAAVIITTYGHNATWVPIALTVISTVTVYLVPNSSPTPPVVAVPPVAKAGEVSVLPCSTPPEV